MSDEEQTQQEIQIQISPDVQRGTYANNMVVAHTQEEFVLDFILLTPPVGTINARVIVSPSHAKRIATALLDNLDKYEQSFGEIATVTQAPSGPIVTH